MREMIKMISVIYDELDLTNEGGQDLNLLGPDEELYNLEKDYNLITEEQEEFEKLLKYEPKF